MRKLYLSLAMLCLSVTVQAQSQSNQTFTYKTVAEADAKWLQLTGLEAAADGTFDYVKDGLMYKYRADDEKGTLIIKVYPICNSITAKGGNCKMRVNAVGIKCYHHVNKS